MCPHSLPHMALPPRFSLRGGKFPARQRFQFGLMRSERPSSFIISIREFLSAIVFEVSFTGPQGLTQKDLIPRYTFHTRFFFGDWFWRTRAHVAVYLSVHLRAALLRESGVGTTSLSLPPSLLSFPTFCSESYLNNRFYGNLILWSFLLART